jgi:filamentous hemagglutinin
LLAGSLVSYTTAGTFNVGATETLAGVQDVSVTANTINNAGSIYAPGVAYLQAAGNINNTGLIYGTGSFNATTGIHQAGIVIALDGTLTNSGAILSDIGSVFIQGWTGKAATEVDNFSGLIQSTTGDVSITAKTFVNEVAGGVTLQSGVQIFNQTYSTPASPSQIPPLLNLCASCLPYYNQDIHIIVPDPLGGPSEVIWYVQDGASSIQVLGYGSTVTLNGAQPLVQAGGNLAITAGSMTNAFGHIQAGGDISLKGGSLNNLGYTTQVTYETQCPQGGSCRNAIPADPSLQPPGYEGSPAWQLGAGQAHAPNFWFTINGVSVAGSIVAGGSIYGNFTGTVDNTTLIANSGAPLATYNNISSLPGTGIAGLPRSDGAGGVVFNGNGGLGLLATLPGGIPSTAALQAGQNAGTLNQAGGNNSGHNGANGTVSGQNNTGGQVNGQAVAITASAVIKALPGGAALFSVDGNPGAKYLITSNPALAAAGTFVGGTYLFQKLGLNGANLPPLLGDAYFDTSYVEQQILAATGRVYLGSVPQTPAAEIQSLLDEAARQAPLLGLETGVDLTPAQQAALTSPIVWYVDRVVNGETVLVPEVYLPSGDANTVLTDGGTISGGKDVAINAGTINNSGAIDAGKQLQLTAKGDIVNNGGTLNGGTDTFISAGGSVYNNSIANSWATTGGTASALQAVGSIASGGDLVITAGADVVSLGGTFASVGTTEMVAGGTIELGTLGLDANDHTVTPGLVTDFSAHTNFAGGVMAGGDMIMAAGNDIDLTAQPLVVGGNADLLAGGSVNFNTATDTESFKQVGNSSGLFSSHSFMDATATSTVDGTSLLAGGDVLLASGVTFKKGAPALVPALAASSSFSGGDTVPANQAGALAGAGTGAGGTNPQIVGNDGVPGSGQNTGSNNTGSSNTGSSPGTQKPPPPPMTVTLADGSTLSLPVNRQQEAILANARPTAGNGKDVTLTAATLMAGGAINVATAGNFVATTGQDTATTTTESEKTGFSFAPTAIGLAAGWSEHSDSNFSTSTETNPIGTTLLGQTISVVSNGDMLLHGATLFATGTPSKPGNITLNADGNITIDAATQTLDTAASNKTMVAGDYMAGLSPSTGVSSASVNTTSQYTIPVGSTLDATGTISITAGKALTVQDGMLNAGGDMTLTGGSVFIGAATGTSVQTNDQNSNQAGVSGKAAGLLGAAANAAYAATQENDQKLAGLDAANALWSIVQAKIMSTAVTVAEVDVEVGANGSSSQQTTTTNTAFGSTLNAGGLLTIKANGQNGSNGNLTVQGSTLDAANITLHAKNDILLNSAQNVSTMTGTTSNYGGAIGVFAQVGSNTGVGIVAEASGGAGHENGTATTQTNTTITTPGILTITSGGNTTLAGATANAGTITADIGGNLTINSVPNTQSIDSNSAQAGGTLHVGFSTNIVEVSGNAAVSMVNGNASTVPVQSGLNASKDIILNVGGTTALNGGVIRAPSGSINTGAFTFSNLDTYSSYTGFALGVAGGGVDGGVDTGSTSSLPLVGVGIDTGGANGHANAAVGNGIIINTSSGSNLTGLSRDPPNANDNVGTLPSLTDLKNNLDFTVGAMTLAEDIGSNPVVQDFVANAAQNVGTFIGNAAQSIGTAANNVLQSIIGDSNNGGTGQVTVLADTTNDGKPYQIASVGSVLNDAANGALKGAAAGAAAGATYGATGGTIVEPGGGTVVGAVGGGLVGGVIGGVLGWVYGAWQSYMTPTSPASAPPTNTGNKDPAYVPPASPGFTPTDPTQTPTDPTAVPPAPAVTPPTDTGNKQPPAVAPPTQVNNTSTDQAIDNITKGLPDVSNPGASEQSLQKGGGSGAAQADFDSLAAVPGATVKMAGSTQVVVLPDGSTAGLYDQAKSTGQPTIQINRPGGSSIKIRY